MTIQTSEVSVPVLIVGAGPAGLLSAFSLAKHGVKSMIIERNSDTTKWPKMTLHNSRTMELLRRLDLEEGVRSAGVPTHNNFRSVFHSGLSEGGQAIGSWDYPSPDDWQQDIAKTNDGTTPRVPYQRCAQSAFERYLRPILDNNELIDARYGVKFERLEEKDDHVVSELTSRTGDKIFVTSKYVLGCDGGGSRVRRNIGSVLAGGPVPYAYYLVSFVSHDTARLRPEGQNWHIFFTSGGYLIAQNEDDIWTVHKSIDLRTDPSTMDPYQVIYEGLGGSTGIPYKVEVDKILVTSTWRPVIAIVSSYRSKGGKVFLAGDAAHQNIPTGGYGYNTAVGDSTDIGWKIAAVLKGWGGEHLLSSYEIERRPVAVRNLEFSGVHAETHRKYVTMVGAEPFGTIMSRGKEGEDLRQRVRDHVHTENIENGCHGVELGCRYNGSPIIVTDKQDTEPVWTVTDYIPSTWPGSRPPHVWLKGREGEVSVFDLFGDEFTLVDFTKDRRFLNAFEPAIKKFGIPVKFLHLSDEDHIRQIWGRDAALVRPDVMVAWQAAVDGKLPSNMDEILAISIGKQTSVSISDANEYQRKQTEFVLTRGFKAVMGDVDPATAGYKAEFQQED